MSIQRSNGISWTPFDGEVLMMNIDLGQYFSLNGVGSRIWELLELPTDVSRIVEQLTTEYDVPSQTCTEHVEAFLSELRARGLVFDSA